MSNLWCNACNGSGIVRAQTNCNGDSEDVPCPTCCPPEPMIGERHVNKSKNIVHTFNTMKFWTSRKDYTFYSEDTQEKFDVVATYDPEFNVWHAQVILSVWGAESSKEAVEKLKNLAAQFTEIEVDE